MAAASMNRAGKLKDKLARDGHIVILERLPPQRM